MKRLFQIAIAIFGLTVLILTYKTDLIAPILGYPSGITILLSLVSLTLGQYIISLFWGIGVITGVLTFFMPNIVNKLIGYNGYILGIVYILIGVVIFLNCYVFDLPMYKYYCGGCGRYMAESKPIEDCDYCGYNRYTRKRRFW